MSSSQCQVDVKSPLNTQPFFNPFTKKTFSICLTNYQFGFLIVFQPYENESPVQSETYQYTATEVEKWLERNCHFLDRSQWPRILYHQ